MRSEASCSNFRSLPQSAFISPITHQMLNHVEKREEPRQNVNWFASPLVFRISAMGLFEPTFLRVKVTVSFHIVLQFLIPEIKRGATVCSVIQMILAVVLAVFPMIRGLKKLLYPLREWEPFDCHFLAENLTILIAIFLLLSAILILIGNSKKRYLFFVPALIIQVNWVDFSILISEKMKFRDIFSVNSVIHLVRCATLF